MLHKFRAPTTQLRPIRLAALCIIVGFTVWFAFGVYRSTQRAAAARELRAMGFEAGGPDIMQLARTNWRGIFNRKAWQWRDQVRLLGGNMETLEKCREPLHRFRPRGVLIGFCERLEDVSALRQFPNLERLDFYECPNVDAGIVSEFAELQELTLRGSPSLRSLDIIKAGKNLVSLHISGCDGLTDLKALPTFTSLRSLYLSDCPALTDTELLRRFTNLEELDLSGCDELTNVDGVCSLKTLKTVDLRRCSKLKADTVAKLRTALPNAKISYP